MALDLSLFRQRPLVHRAIFALTVWSFLFNTISFFTKGWVSTSIWGERVDTYGISCSSCRTNIVNAGLAASWISAVLAFMVIPFLANIALIIYGVVAWFLLKEKPWVILVDIILSAVACVSLILVLIIFPAGLKDNFIFTFSAGYSYFLIFPAILTSGASVAGGIICQRQK